MNARRQIQEGHEFAVLTMFIQWLVSQGFPRYELVDRPNPPDGILRTGTTFLWVEIADAYRSADEAHEERSHATPGEVPFVHREHPITSPDERTAEAVLRAVVKKKENQSYRAAFEQYGQGILICCERDPLYDQSTLQEVLDLFEDYCEDLRILNGGVFKDIYLNERPQTFHKLRSFPVETALT